MNMDFLCLSGLLLSDLISYIDDRGTGTVNNGNSTVNELLIICHSQLVGNYTLENLFLGSNMFVSQLV